MCILLPSTYVANNLWLRGSLGEGRSVSNLIIVWGFSWLVIGVSLWVFDFMIVRKRSANTNLTWFSITRCIWTRFELMHQEIERFLVANWLDIERHTQAVQIHVMRTSIDKYFLRSTRETMLWKTKMDGKQIKWTSNRIWDWKLLCRYVGWGRRTIMHCQSTNIFLDQRVRRCSDKIGEKESRTIGHPTLWASKPDDIG